MTFQINVTDNASSELDECAAYIAERNPQAAANWLNSIGYKIASLATFPDRFPYARENVHHDRELRQLVAGNYRIIYHADEAGQVVTVLSVRHSARIPHAEGELDPPETD